MSAEARRFTWRAESPNHEASVSQSFVRAGLCQVEGNGSAGRWSVDQCLGTSFTLWFVSPSGDRLLGIDPMPSTTDPWGEAEVVTLFEKGKRVAGTNAAAFVPRRRDVKLFSKHFAWVAGTYEIPGSEPRAVGSAVDGVTVTGQTFHFGFDGTGIPAHGIGRADPRPEFAPEVRPVATTPSPSYSYAPSGSAALPAAQVGRGPDEAAWRREYEASRRRQAQLDQNEKQAEATVRRLDGAVGSGNSQLTPTGVENYERAKAVLRDAEAARQREREAQHELDRKAANEGVPNEWRR